MKTWMKVLICCVLSFAFLFTAMGYAALTDILNISGTVNVDNYVLFTVTYMIGDKVYLVDYHTDPATNYTVKGTPDGYSDFKQWVNANGDAVTTIPGYNTNDYVLYATWLNKYTINFIDAGGNLIHSEEFTEGATSISGEGKAIVDRWLAIENEKENVKQISVKWSSYNLGSATGDLIVRPQYDYNGYLNLVPVYEQPDDGVVDYYQIKAVDTLPKVVTVPGNVGSIPVTIVERITNVDGANDWDNFEYNVTTIIIEENIERLERNALAWTPNLDIVYLPNTLNYIGKNVFSRNISIPFVEDDKKVLTIHFNGTIAEWNAVSKHEDWDNGLQEGSVVICTDGYIAYEKPSRYSSVQWIEHPGQTTLKWRPDMIETNEIALSWDGIDDTNMDLWYPVDEQNPVPGDSYEMAFEPAESYVMVETIRVLIDDTEFVVQTNGHAPEGEVVPTYDPERNVLTIPAELLTTETKMVAIVAYAVAIESEVAAEST